MMKAVHSEGPLLKQGGRLQLIRLHGHWQVVEQGYLCMMDGFEEGVLLIERFRERACSLTDGPLPSHGPTPGTHGA